MYIVFSASVCDICGAKFKNNSNLNQHMKSHNEGRELFKCDIEGCERTFMYRKNMKQHIRAFHNGEKFWKDRKRKKVVVTRDKMVK